MLVVGRLPRRFCSCGVDVSGSWELPELGLGEVLLSSHLHSSVPLFTAYDGSETGLASQLQTPTSCHLK